MLRRCFIIISLLALAGCQSKAPAPAAGRAPVASAEREYEAVAASALVFDPPVSMDQRGLQLDRAEREPRVAVGYDGPIIETYSVRMDDRQIGISGAGGGGHSGSGRGGFGGMTNFDRYERRAVTERVGVRYR